jgi:hypothetical protein
MARKVMRKLRFHFVFAASCGAGFMLFSWLLPFCRFSPVGWYVYAVFNLVPFLVAKKLSNNDVPGEFAYWAFLFGQWFIVGFFTSFLFWKTRSRL